MIAGFLGALQYVIRPETFFPDDDRKSVSAAAGGVEILLIPSAE